SGEAHLSSTRDVAHAGRVIALIGKDPCGSLEHVHEFLIVFGQRLRGHAIHSNRDFERVFDDRPSHLWASSSLYSSIPFSVGPLGAPARGGAGNRADHLIFW